MLESVTAFFAVIGEHPLAVAVVSTVGAALGAVARPILGIFFERLVPGYLDRRDRARAAIEKYSYQLLRAADALEARVRIHVLYGRRNWLKKSGDDYYRISTCYVFGAYLGWCRVLEEEAFLEYRLARPFDRRTRDFLRYFYTVFKGLSSFDYVRDRPRSHGGRRYEIPRFAMTAIGELMVRPPAAAGGQDHGTRVLSFLEFAKLYHKSPDFIRWFRPVLELIEAADRAGQNAAYQRLVFVVVHLQIFLEFLDRDNRHVRRRMNAFLQNLPAAVRSLVEEEIRSLDHGYLLTGGV